MNTIATTRCTHCGTPFRPVPQRQEFCCAGCQFVYHLLHKRGFDEFYNYGERKSPAGNFVFHGRDLAWLEEIIRTSEATPGPTARATLDIQGISCAGCVWLLERVFQEHPGAISCRVNSSAGTLRIEWAKGQCDLHAYAEDVRKFGYLLGPAEAEAASATRPLARKLGLCGALAMNAMLFALPRYIGLSPGDRLAHLFDVISLGLATASIVIGGGYFFRRAFTALKSGMLHIDLPISLGLLAAYTGSCVAWVNRVHSFTYFDFVSIFTFLMLLGRWLQERTVENNRRRLLAMKLSPGKVRRADKDVSAEALVAGDRFSIARGNLLPVRSRLLGARTVFALNWITGEPTPREFLRGGIVPAGARNLSAHDSEMESLEPWASSQLAGLMKVESGMTWRNASLQKLISAYLAVVLVTAITGFLAWGILGGDWIQAAQVLVSVLVVSCPCAIGVALPLLDDIAAARLQKSGIYIREGSLWARLRQVSNILFDKTGTITLETLALENPEALASLQAHEKSILLRLVQSSLHPVAACLREALLPAGIEPAEGPGNVVEVTGFGLEWITSAGTWRLGRSSWSGEPFRPPPVRSEECSARMGDKVEAASRPLGKASKRQDAASTGFHRNDPGSSAATTLTLDGHQLAAFSFREELRPGAAGEVASLQAGGRQVYLLSGDDAGRVALMADGLGLPEDHAFGNLTPEDKAGLVKSRWPGSSLMIGDGANDSLAFDAALCRGTPSVDTGLLEHKADFYMPGSGLGGLTNLFRAAARHTFTTRAVFAFTIAYNASAVAASLAGFMNPLVAAVIMPLSSLISIGIVLLGFRPPSNQPE